MPLIKSGSKKALKKNIETEMEANPSKGDRKQNLAIAFSVQRKNKRKKMDQGGEVDDSKKSVGEIINYPGSTPAPKASPSPKYADGGEVNAKNQKRPMPDDLHDDRAMASRNSGNKPPKNDSWVSNITITQAQKPSPTKLSRPPLMGSDAFSVRNSDMRYEEEDLMDHDAPSSPADQPRKRMDEEDADGSGHAVRDMDDQHNNGRAPYKMAKEDQYSEDEASSDMKQKYAKGGPVMEPKDSGIQLRERDDEAHLMSMEDPSEDEGAADAHSRNEMDPDRQGPAISDNELQHSDGRKAYADGGDVQFKDAEENEDSEHEPHSHMNQHSADDSEDQPHDEEEIEHAASLAAAVMARMKARGGEAGNPKLQQSHMEPEELKSVADAIRGRKRMAEGGEVDDKIGGRDSLFSFPKEDQADVKRNAEEDANMEDQSSFNALRKENYSESEGLRQMDSPRDSNLKGDDIDSDAWDHISEIRKRMRAKRGY